MYSYTYAHVKGNMDIAQEKLEQMDTIEIAIAVGLLGNMIKDVAKQRTGEDAKVLDAFGCILISLPMYLMDENIGVEGIEILHRVAHVIQMASESGRDTEQMAEMYASVGAALLSGASFVTGKVSSEDELTEVARVIRNAMGIPFDDQPLDPEVAEWLAIMTGRGKVGTD